MIVEWPPSLGDNNDRWTAEWVESNGRRRGQVFGGPRGLWYAINSSRSHANHFQADTITGPRGVVYDLLTGVDELSICPRCGRICQDPSTHVPTATREGLPR